MSFWIEFFPLVLFFLVYKWQGIYWATAVLMACSCVQAFYWKKTQGKLSPLQLITLILIGGFGALTLGFHDERFIQWKPTVLYALMALILWAALGVWRKNVLQLLLGSQLVLPSLVWNRLIHIWALYFVLMASMNAYAVVFWSVDEWMNFKLWGYIFPVIFIIGQGLYIAPHLKKRP